ncbi:cyclic nucleotide-binding domain-containing protein [Motiliproteus sediminis]|uniref:cyclic nucleotide-binding domain-containing protein n=1 Tax=Motiliproteus sediminis TaxID=1468178 RepID=UPI001AEF4A3D|nr:cyclic nucleotide-binding domain-containing protein [Motiliproteus sediminis]
MASIGNLQSYAMFGGVSDQQLIVLSRLLKAETFPEGAFLFHQGDKADRLFFIQQGQVEVLNRLSDDTLVPLAKRQEGDSIGEMAIIDQQNRSASVRALESVTVLSLSCAALSELHRTDPELYTLMLMNLARELSRRLRATDAVVASSLFARSVANAEIGKF